MGSLFDLGGLLCDNGFFYCLGLWEWVFFVVEIILNDRIGFFYVDIVYVIFVMVFIVI